MHSSGIESLVMVLAIVLFAYITTDRLFRVKKININVGLLSIYGLEFIILGLLIGKPVLGWVRPFEDPSFRPLIIIVLSWAGLLFGMQFKRKYLELIPRKAYKLTLVESSSVIIIVLSMMSLAFFLILGRFYFRESLILAMSLASCSVASSSAVVTSVIRKLKPKGILSSYLKVFSALDGSVGLLLMMATISLARFYTETGLAGIPWFLSCIFLGCVLGFLYHFLLNLHVTPDQRLAKAVGMIVFLGGVSYYLPASPLFIGAIAGAVLVNVSHRSDHLYKLLAGGERSLYGLLLLMGGASLKIDSGLIVVLIVIYLFVRIFAKVIGTKISLRMGGFKNASWSGFALIAQGGIALAMAFDFSLLVPRSVGNILMSFVIISALVNNVVGPILTERVIKKSEAKS